MIKIKGGTVKNWYLEANLSDVKDTTLVLLPINNGDYKSLKLGDHILIEATIYAFGLSGGFVIESAHVNRDKIISKISQSLEQHLNRRVLNRRENDR